MIWNEILCLGDSITTGARDRYHRSYPMQLGKILYEKTREFYFCHDAGVCGDTSSHLLRRVWGEVKKYQNSKIAVLMIGTNDTEMQIPEEVYEDNLRQIVSIVKLHGMHLIVSKLPSLGFTPLYLKNKDLINTYNKVIDRQAMLMGFDVCELKNTEKYYIDGVHYSHEGYNKLAEIFSEKILSLQER
jgi:lysophospholipase L1-like esterase